MDLWPPDQGMKHYTAEMLSEWGQPGVALSATSNLWVITGPSGAGKSRVGRYLRDELGLIFIEGDDVSLIPIYDPSLSPDSKLTPAVPHR